MNLFLRPIFPNVLIDIIRDYTDTPADIFARHKKINLQSCMRLSHWIEKVLAVFNLTSQDKLRVFLHWFEIQLVNISTVNPASSNYQMYGLACLQVADNALLSKNKRCMSAATFACHLAANSFSESDFTCMLDLIQPLQTERYWNIFVDIGHVFNEAYIFSNTSLWIFFRLWYAELANCREMQEICYMWVQESMERLKIPKIDIPPTWRNAALDIVKCSPNFKLTNFKGIDTITTVSLQAKTISELIHKKVTKRPKYMRQKIWDGLVFLGAI
jgi:hypothetical protein